MLQRYHSIDLDVMRSSGWCAWVQDTTGNTEPGSLPTATVSSSARSGSPLADGVQSAACTQRGSKAP